MLIARSPRPRIACAGLGWIGRNRMEAIAHSGLVQIVALADPDPEALSAAAAVVPDARRVATFEEALETRPDGVMIATPSALHGPQTVAALSRGCAVFCQKPLGRDAAEARAAVEAARRADRRLAVDLSYRRTAALRAIRARVRAGSRSGGIGHVFAADLAFHNAYGPDKRWFYDRAQSGGGCVMDLGVHLVDAALWTLDFPRVEGVEARLFAGGAPAGPDAVEDYAVATLHLAGGTVARLACSWRLHAGADAVIEAAFHGTRGGLALRNPGGGFYDFEARRHDGTRSDLLAAPPDDWGGRAAVAWAQDLARGCHRFDDRAWHLVTLAETLDRIYAAAGTAPPDRLRATGPGARGATDGGGGGKPVSPPAPAGAGR